MSRAFLKTVHGSLGHFVGIRLFYLNRCPVQAKDEKLKDEKMDEMRRQELDALFDRLLETLEEQDPT